MRVVILGGTGFLGPHIAERLLAFGHEVTVFHRGAGAVNLPKGAGIIQGDRNELHKSAGDFRRLRPDVLVDAIAFTESHAESLVAVARGIAGRIVVLSSGDVYRAYDILFGRVEGGVEAAPLVESSSLRERLYPHRGTTVPQPSGFSWDDYDKILVERVVLRDGNPPATVLRLPMVYGPGAKEAAKRRFFPFLKRMDDGRSAILLDKRTARWRAPFGYAGDVAEAVRLVVENDRAAGQIYNVGEPYGLDMQGWIQELAEVAGWTGQVVVSDQPCPPPNFPRQLNLDQHLDMDTIKIRRELGYCETLSRREAIRKTVSWEREHRVTEVDPAQFDYPAEDAILNHR